MDESERADVSRESPDRKLFSSRASATKVSAGLAKVEDRVSGKQASGVESGVPRREKESAWEIAGGNVAGFMRYPRAQALGLWSAGS